MDVKNLVKMLVTMAMSCSSSLLPPPPSSQLPSSAAPSRVRFRHHLHKARHNTESGTAPGQECSRASPEVGEGPSITMSCYPCLCHPKVTASPGKSLLSQQQRSEGCFSSDGGRLMCCPAPGLRAPNVGIAAGSSSSNLCASSLLADSPAGKNNLLTYFGLRSL